MAERRHGRRQNVARLARTAARREDMKENGVWTLFDQAVQVQGSNSGSRQAAVTISPVPVQPCTVYGVHLASSVALIGADSGANADVPIRGVLALTKLSSAEQVAGSTGPGIIADPALEADINDRPWRHWMPFLLTGDASDGQPWAIAPIRLPMKGMHKLDIGQRLAIVLALPQGSTQTRTVRLTVWGRYRYIVHRTS